MAFWNRLARPAPRVTDLTHLLEPGWTGGKITAVQSGDGTVSIHANSLTRDEAGTGNVLLCTLPAELRPVEHKYGDHTLRGRAFRILNSGSVQITDPVAILDYASSTYVAKGGV